MNTNQYLIAIRQTRRPAGRIVNNNSFRTAAQYEILTQAEIDEVMAYKPEPEDRDLWQVIGQISFGRVVHVGSTRSSRLVEWL